MGPFRMYSRASVRVRTPLSPMNRRNSVSFNNSRMKRESLNSSWRSARRAVRMTVTYAAEASSAWLGMRLLALFIVEGREQVRDSARILGAALAQSRDHSLPVGCRMILAEFPFAREPRDL